MTDPRPLGRIVEHDERSRQYPVEAMAAQHLASVLHQRHVPIFDQGQIGSCTGNAAAGAMATGPWTHHTTERDAVALYSAATHLDHTPGIYPPDDTGSSGLAVMKAVRARGWINAYRHCFSLAAVQTALQTTPVIAGINWYEGFDSPGAHGLVTIAGAVRGGHEICLVGLDVTARTLRAANSWGASYGDHGYFTVTLDDFDRLLHEHGDVTVPIGAP